ncbi:hypothetical protein BC835DRAFT_1422384 [Cytidiella melzeri]|nr:hypothetical protein BC835DRAFT_1422384 [Cytidiella melzeri]
MKAKEFVEARERGTTREWIVQVYQAWFNQFPEPPLTPAEVAAAGGHAEKAALQLAESQKTQLYWWFQNHNCGSTSGAGSGEVLPLGKKKRKLQLYQAYLKLHRERKLSFIACVAKELLEKEPEEVKRAVEAFRNDDTIVIDGEDDDLDVSKVKAQQNTIDNIPRTLKACLDDLKAMTGWIGSIIVGGPDPRTGSFKSFAYHVGTTVNANCRLDQLDGCWNEVEKTFGGLLPKCYSVAIEKELHGNFTAGLSRTGTPVNDSRAGTPSGEVSAERVGTSQASEALGSSDTFKEDRQRQIHANQELLKSLGLEPLAKKASLRAVITPRPITNRVASRAGEKPPSTRELRAGQNPSAPVVEPAPLPGAADPASTAQENAVGSEPSASTANPPVPSNPQMSLAAVQPSDTSAASSAPPAQPTSPAAQPPSSPPSIASSTVAQNAIVADLPQWWSDAFAYLSEVSDESKWKYLCDRWLAHERELGFPDGSAANRLPTDGRPDEVRYWLS